MWRNGKTSERTLVQPMSHKFPCSYCLLVSVEDLIAYFLADLKIGVVERKLRTIDILMLRIGGTMEYQPDNQIRTFNAYNNGQYAFLDES